MLKFAKEILDAVTLFVEIEVEGSEKITISGWYRTNASAKVMAFNTADGMKLDSQSRNWYLQWPPIPRI